jgi:Arc/MetJ-type ribon-helix-helix transcriptional regulator
MAGDSQFDKVVNVRLSEDVLANAELILKEHKDDFESLSHYIRAAVIRMNREYASGRLR